jgi:hypothetical protein
MKRSKPALLEAVAILLLSGNAWAATYHVAQTTGASDANPGTATSPMLTIQAGVNKAQAGDTVLIHTGTYRESVKAANSGTAQAGILISTAGDGEVTLSGADVVPASQWVGVPGSQPIWQHTPWTYQGVTHPSDQPLVGRTEQVIADGNLLQQVLVMNQMTAGTFYADPVTAKALYIWLTAGDSPASHTIETSLRKSLLSLTGSYIVVSGLHFIYGTNPAQSSVLDVEGSNNVAQDCIVEWTNGCGAGLGGSNNTMLRLISRFNGQQGLGSSQSTQNLMEDCTLQGNNVKGFPTGWEAGGMKVSGSRQFHILRCLAIQNNGNGFWWDVDDQDGVIEQSYAADNLSGIMVEISENITVQNNLCIRNGLTDTSGANWGDAGIKLGEAMSCTVQHNVTVNNRTGIEVRQQGVRTVTNAPGKEFYSDALVFDQNISAFNTVWQWALYGDNGFWGGSGSPLSEPDLDLLNPDLRHWKSTGDLYYPTGSGEGLILWGAGWRPNHVVYSDLPTFLAAHNLEQGSLESDPLFLNWQAGNFDLSPASPAIGIGSGFTEQPVLPGQTTAKSGRQPRRP